MPDHSTCPSHGNITQALAEIKETVTKFDGKLDRYNERLAEGAVRFENMDGRLKACESRDASMSARNQDVRKAGLDGVKTLIVMGLGTILGAGLIHLTRMVP